MTAPDSLWIRLAAAARARLRSTPSADETAPLGFSTRVVALWREAREADRRLQLWQRLSWRAAFTSLVVCLGVAVAQRQGTVDRAMIEPPALEFPTLDSRS